MERDRFWYPMQQVVLLPCIPYVTYTGNKSYKSLLVKRKKNVLLNWKPRKLGLPRLCTINEVMYLEFLLSISFAMTFDDLF